MYAKQLVQQETNFDAVRKVIKGLKNPFNIGPLHQSLSSGLNNSEIFKYLKSYNLTELIAPNLLNETFPCHFIKGNIAWMSEQEGHYRYFTRNYKGYLFSLDLLDFLTLYYDTQSLSEIIQKLSNKSGIIYLDKRWRKSQKEKYENNLMKFDINDFNYDEQKLLSPLVEVYRFLNEEGMRNLGPMNLSLGHDAMFFTSYRYISKKLEMSSSQVGRICLMLEGLGLISTLSDDDIPTAYLHSSKIYAGKKNRVNYYLIHNYAEIGETVRTNCKLFNDKSLKLSNVSRVGIANLH